MDPANTLLAAWYPYDYNMPTPYPSPAPSDPFPLLPPPTRPHPPRRMRQASPDAYAPYQRPRSAPLDAPSPALSSVSSLDSSLRGPPTSASPLSSVPQTHSQSQHHSQSLSLPLPPPRLPRRDQPKHTKHRLRDIDRKNICLYHIGHPHARQEDIGAAFNVERSTISKILKDKARWLNISPEDESSEQTSKHRPSKFPEIEFELRRSLQVWSEQRVSITDHLIRTRALEIAAEHHISLDRFKGSSGWVENFKSRHDIRRGEWPHAVLYAAQHRGPVPPPGQTMGMAYDEHGNHLPPDHQHQHHQQDEPKWASGSHTHAHDNGALDPALRHHQHHQQDASLSSVSSASSSGSAGMHTPLQTQAPLDPTAIQHSPDGYDSHSGAGSQGEYMQAPPHQRQPQPHYPPHPHQHADVQYATAPAEPAAEAEAAPVLAVVGPGPLPTCEQADNAMNIVIDFLDRCAPEGFLVPGERDTLSHVKCALFNLVSGMPYTRR